NFNVNMDFGLGNYNGLANNALNWGLNGLFGGAGNLLGGIAGGVSDFFGLDAGSDGQGISANVPEEQTINENQKWLSTMVQLAFNAAIYIFSYAIIVLTAHQLVFMCYLFLLGPLAAAFFAWPQLSQNSK